MGVDNDTTPESSAGNGQDKSYLDDFTQGAQTGDSPAPEGEQTPESPAGEAGDTNSPDGGQQQETALDVVKRAAEAHHKEGDGESPRSDADGQDTADKKADGDTDTKAGEKDKAGEGEGEQAEDDSDLPFHKHPRWQQMKQQRDEFKEKAEAAEAQLQELGDVNQVKEQATRYQEINGFLSQHGLNGDDFANGLHVMNLMKNDPESALPYIESYYHALQRMTGNTVPDDLKQKVDDGLIDEETAQQLSRERAQAARLKQQNQQLSQAEQQRQREYEQYQAQSQQQETVKKLATAADEWETKWQKSDPDYDKLADMVRLRVQEIMAQTKVEKPEDVVKVCDKARDDVKAYVRKLMPGKQPNQPLPDGASAGGQQPHPAPKTSLEAAKLAVGQ